MLAAERYAHDVLEGRKVAGLYIKQAAQRFLNDRKRTDIEFNEKEANRAVNFIERKLRHWEGSWRGKPMILEDWQKFIVQQIFGWFNNGKRRIRSVYIQIARKNGKTSFAAAILLYHLIADRENTPQILVGANNEDQAKICVNSAGRIIQQSPDFSDDLDDETIKLSIYGRNIIGIYHKEKDGVVKPMSKNPDTQDGFNPSIGVVDEYHEAKDDALLNVIESGQGARPEPILFVITTAGFVKTGPCYSKLRRSSIEILAGKTTDDAHLAFIWEPDEDDKWDDETSWHKSNPNLNVSVFVDYLRTRLTKAKNEGSSKEVDFKTKNLNMWVDAPTVWIQDDTWTKNHYPVSKYGDAGIKIEDLIGARCFGGLDLSTGIDLNAFALMFPNFKEINGKWITPVLWWFWIPKTMVKTETFDYSDWVNAGYITPTEGVFENVIDHMKIVADIVPLPLQYYIQAIAFDQRLAYHGVVQSLGATFGTSEKEDIVQGLYPYTQSMPNVSAPTKELETLITNSQLEHFNNPVARWMMGNVVLKKDAAGQIMPDKSKSQFKIDGIAAMVNAKAIATKAEALGFIETQSTSL
jgi:phage terminase large subunit-like protein